MKIAIRDKEIFINYADRFDDETISSPPYGYKLADVPDDIADDIEFSDFDNVGGDYAFNAERRADRVKAETENEKAELYKAKIDELIRRKYSINDEIAILRQKSEKPDEFTEYYEYVEAAKREARAEIKTLKI